LEQLNPTSIRDLDDRDNNMKVDEMGGVHAKIKIYQFWWCNQDLCLQFHDALKRTSAFS
jgi:hypothetical protein